MHEISKQQYGDLVRAVQKQIQANGMKGGGRFDFSAAETYVEQLPEIPFYIHVDSMDGGGKIKDSLKALGKRVLKATLKKGAEVVADKGVDLGKKAIEKLGKAAEKVGVPSSIASAATDRAEKALEGAEGPIKEKVMKAEKQLEKKLGLEGDGITVRDVVSNPLTQFMAPGVAIPASLAFSAKDKLLGRGMHPAGSGLMQTGDGMKVSGSGHYHGGASGFVTRPSATPGIPAGSMQVGFSNHISSRMPAGGY